MFEINGAQSNSPLLNQVQEKRETLFEQLSSGKRVNDAADDAAAQQIIDRLTSQVEGNRQAISNAYDGVSLAQIAEGGLEGINQDANRIRELTLQAGNGALGDADREAIQSEITQLQDNISQTIQQTEIGGKPLLSQNGEIQFQVGANPDQKVGVQTQDIGNQLSNLLSVDLSNGTSVDDALNAADEAIQTVGDARAELGAVQSRFESTARSLSQADTNAAAARSRIQDTDYAQAVSAQVANDTLGQAALSVQAQSNQQQGQVLSLLS